MSHRVCDITFLVLQPWQTHPAVQASSWSVNDFHMSVIVITQPPTRYAISRRNSCIWCANTSIVTQTMPALERPISGTREGKHNQLWSVSPYVAYVSKGAKPVTPADI